MPIEMKKEPAGWFFVRVSGTLVKQDYNKFEPEFRQATGADNKLRLLVDMRTLEGWEPAALWEEIKFDVQHFKRMQRLAVLGSKHWQHVMTSFADIFTGAEIQYFEPNQEELARIWLSQ